MLYTFLNDYMHKYDDSFSLDILQHFYGFLQYPKQAPILPIFRFYAFYVQLTRNQKTEELKRKPYIKCAFEFRELRCNKILYLKGNSKLQGIHDMKNIL